MSELPNIQTALGADVALPVTGDTILHLRQQIAEMTKEIHDLRVKIAELEETSYY